MSRIHFAGFCGQAFRSRDAPPKKGVRAHTRTHTDITEALICKKMFCTILDFVIVSRTFAVLGKCCAVNTGDLILTFDESEELFMFDFIVLHVNLQRQQQGEQELMLLKQAPRCILKNLKGHIFYDVGYTFACDWVFDRPVDVHFI